jgi:hypothetical protein
MNRLLCGPVGDYFPVCLFVSLQYQWCIVIVQSLDAGIAAAIGLS